MAKAHERAVAGTYLRMKPLLGQARRAELGGLLIVGPELKVSRLAWLHRGATTASAMAIRIAAALELLADELDTGTVHLLGDRRPIRYQITQP